MVASIFRTLWYSGSCTFENSKYQSDISCWYGFQQFRCSEFQPGSWPALFQTTNNLIRASWTWPARCVFACVWTMLLSTWNNWVHVSASGYDIKSWRA